MEAFQEAVSSWDDFLMSWRWWGHDIDDQGEDDYDEDDDLKS